MTRKAEKMDGRRFDRLARNSARWGSRRSVLAGGTFAIAALMGRARAASAQPYSVPLGDVCYDDSQCIPAEPGNSVNIAYCADNGFDWDGDRNCCHGYGGWCRADSDCCGSLDCIGDMCASPYEQCQGYAEPCRDDLDCCGSLFCGPGYCTTPYE